MKGILGRAVSRMKGQICACWFTFIGSFVYHCFASLIHRQFTWGSGESGYCPSRCGVGPELYRPQYVVRLYVIGNFSRKIQFLLIRLKFL